MAAEHFAGRLLCARRRSQRPAKRHQAPDRRRHDQTSACMPFTNATMLVSSELIANEKTAPGRLTAARSITPRGDNELARKAAMRARSNTASAMTDAEAEPTPEPFAFLIHVVSEPERQGAAEQQFHPFLLKQTTTAATVAGVTVPAGSAPATIAAQPSDDGDADAEPDQGLHRFLLL